MALVIAPTTAAAILNCGGTKNKAREPTPAPTAELRLLFRAEKGALITALPARRPRKTVPLAAIA